MISTPAFDLKQKYWISWSELKLSIPLFLTVLLLALLAEPFVGHAAVGISFIIATGISGLFFREITVVILATLYMLIYSYWLLPPVGTLRTTHPEDFALLIALFLAAVSFGILVRQLKEQALLSRSREQGTRLLYIFAQRLAEAQSLDAIARLSCEAIAEIFTQPIALLLFLKESADGPVLRCHEISAFRPLSKDQEEILRAFDQSMRPADFLIKKTSAGHSFAPLIGREGLVGFIVSAGSGFFEARGERLRLLTTLANQIAVAIERENFHAQSQTVAVMERTQKLYKTLLNSVSHELKTPLVAITGSASALLDECSNRDRHLVESFATEILSASQRLRRVVENLLDMSRIDSGTLRPRRHCCDLRDLLAVLLQRLELEGFTQAVRFDVSDDVPEIWLDPILLDQALANILHNARIYGGCTQPIEIAVRADNEHCIISIRDHGPGLPGGDSQRVFDKFYRGSPEKTGGLGLGLSIAQGFIEAQGGQIRAANHQEGGAIFRIALPRETLA